MMTPTMSYKMLTMVTRYSEVQYHDQEYKGKNPRPPILLWYQTKPTMSITIFLRVCFCFLVRFTKISQSGFCSSLKATARWWFSSTDSSLYIRASSEPKHETMNTWWTGSHYCWPWRWYVRYSLHIARRTFQTTLKPWQLSIWSCTIITNKIKYHHNKHYHLLS